MNLLDVRWLEMGFFPDEFTFTQMKLKNRDSANAVDFHCVLLMDTSECN